MKKLLDVRKDLPKLTPCAARLVELLIEAVPYTADNSYIHMNFIGNKKAELDLRITSPSSFLLLEIESSPEGVEIRFSEPGKAGTASAIFFMHPLNFHRTCEAVVDFVSKIFSGHIIVAREKNRTFPFFGHKRVRFFEAGEIVGRASEIEQVYKWKDLNI